MSKVLLVPAIFPVRMPVLPMLVPVHMPVHVLSAAHLWVVGRGRFSRACLAIATATAPSISCCCCRRQRPFVFNNLLPTYFTVTCSS